MPSSLVDSTRAKLRADARSLSQISVASGISYHWLSSFKYERSSNPGAAEVQKLYEFLFGRPLIQE